MLQCTNEGCEIDWLHMDCIVDSTLTRLYNACVDSNNGINGSSKGTKGSLKRKSTAQGSYEDRFTARMFPKQKPPKMAITDKKLNQGDWETWPERCVCPGCQTPID
jgi:hypothetical protein